MKKITSILCFFLFASLVFIQFGCKKEEIINSNPCPVATYPITGLWVGTFTGNGVPGSPRFYSLTIYPDGTILTKGDISSGYSYSEGTWTISNNVFTATITGLSTPITQRINATFSNSGTLTNATWQDTVNPFGTLLSGEFQNMARIN